MGLRNRRRVAILSQYLTDRGRVLIDNCVVAGIPCCPFGNHAEMHGVMVATRNQRGPRRRAERTRMETGVSKSRVGNPVERRCRDRSTERTR